MTTWNVITEVLIEVLVTVVEAVVVWTSVWVETMVIVLAGSEPERYRVPRTSPAPMTIPMTTMPAVEALEAVLKPSGQTCL